MPGAAGTRSRAGARSASRRQYFRVRTRLRIRHRLLASAEIDAACLEIEAGGRNGGLPLDPRLLAHLERIESKLDQLLALVGPALPEPLVSLETREVEISGAGLRMAARPRPPVGSSILIEFLLPGSSVPVRAIGVVRRHVEPTTPGADPEIAVAFRAIHDSDRQSLVHFSLEAERCRLRARSVGERPVA